MLELTASSGKSEIRQAYLNLVKVWHPDLFTADDPERDESEERFKQIQVAYRELQQHFTEHATSSRGGRNRGVNPSRDEAFITALKALLIRYADRHKVVYGDRRIYIAPKVPHDVLKETAPQSAFGKDGLVGVVRAGGVAMPWQRFVLLGKDQALIHAPATFDRSLVDYARLFEFELRIRRHGQRPTSLSRWTKRVGLAPEESFRETLQIADLQTGNRAVLFEHINGDARITQSLLDLLTEIQRLAGKDKDKDEVRRVV